MPLINDKQFTYVHDYKEDKHLRHSFNELTQKVYSFDFEQWYQDGYWNDKCIPHSLLFENTVVANTSVSMIEFDLFGQKRKYLQLGTVMTAPEFRSMGLSRFLVDKIMMQWKDRCDLIYLFANDSVLPFYPKFGFEKVLEYQLSKEIKNGIPTFSAQKVDMDDSRNRQALIKKIKQAKSFSAFEMTNDNGLIMCHLTFFMKNDVYYLPEHDTYVIAVFDGDVICLQGVFCADEIELTEIIPCIMTKEAKKIILGFTPKCENGFEKNVLVEEDTTLFVWGDDADRLRESKVMFPLISRT